MKYGIISLQYLNDITLLYSTDITLLYLNDIVVWNPAETEYAMFLRRPGESPTF